MSFPISALFSTMGIGFFLGLLAIDLIHDLGNHAPNYYPKVLKPCIVTPFLFSILGIFAISAIIRLLNETSRLRAVLRTILLLGSAFVFFDVLKSETELIGVTVGVN